jgi:hypothetical protein
MNATDQLLAIEEIKRLKARYFRCVDTKDWAGLRAVFATGTLGIDLSGAHTPVDHTGSPVIFDGVVPPAPNPASQYDNAEAFVVMVERTLGAASVIHHGHMPEIEVTSPTTARGVWSMEDMIRWPGGAGELHGYGHYHETYELTAEGWRIRTLRLTRLRVDGKMPTA